MQQQTKQRRVRSSMIVLAILCAMSFVMYIDRTNIATAALAIRSDLHLSNSQLGFVFSAFAVVYAVAMIPGSWVADKIGAHKMLAICGVLWATGTLLTGLAGGLYGLILARFIVGLGESAIVPTSAKALAVWVEPQRRGFAQGITHSFARLGNAAAPLVVAALIVKKMDVDVLRYLITVVVFYTAAVMARAAVKGHREHRAEGATAPLVSP